MCEAEGEGGAQSAEIYGFTALRVHAHAKWQRPSPSRQLPGRDGGHNVTTIIGCAHTRGGGERGEERLES